MYFTLITLLASLLSVHSENTKKIPTKKGCGLGQGQYFAHLKLLNVSWYYDWYSKERNRNKVDNTATYIPMFKFIDSKDTIFTPSPVILGYNEPDCFDHGTIEESRKVWEEKVVKLAPTIVSPAMCHNFGDKYWLPKFLPNMKIDAIAIHWYGGISSNKFINDMTKLYNYYRKPLWITEFAPQYRKLATERPTQFTIIEVQNFIIKTTDWMEKTDWIHRYAYHDPRIGNCKLFSGEPNGNGTVLTSVGKTYSDVISKIQWF